MKKKLLVFSTAAALLLCLALAFSACSFTDGHTHTYAEEWTADESFHWHAATCEHAEEKRGKIAHTFGDVVLDVAPTESAAGTGHKTCSVCGYQLSVTIEYSDSHVHAYTLETVSENAKRADASCTERASYFKSCECGEVSTTDFFYVGDLLPHTFDREMASGKYLVSAADCTSAAVFYKSCQCGVAGEDTFSFGAALGHSYTAEVVAEPYLKSPATCTAKAVYYKSCVCGEKGTVTFTYGEKLAHTFDREVASATYLKSAATCTSKALYYKSCSCGAKGTETFEVGELLAHSYSREVASEMYLKSVATCTAKAVHYKSCVCGAKGTETFESGEMLAHTYNQEVASETYLKSAATCTAKAVYYKSCVCGAKGTETFENGEMLAHTYNQEAASETYLKSAATCTAKAVYYKSCVCGAKGTETFESGEMLAHTYNQEVVSATYQKSAATCTSKALYYKSCSCGAKGSETFEVGDLLPHVYNQEETSETYLKSAATCTAKALYNKSCVCGAKGTETFEVGEMLAHTYNQEVATDTYLKSAASHTSAALYYKSCVCGAKGTETFEVGAPIGHSYQSVATTPATCLTSAVKTMRCSCGDEYEEPDGDALGHDISGVTPTETLVEGCEYVQVYVCKRQGCGAEVSGEHVFHHVYTASIKTAATCEVAGEKVLSCSCGDTKTEAIPKNENGHNWQKGTEAGGFRTDTCSICQAEKTVTVYSGNATDSKNAEDFKDTEIELSDANIKLGDGVIDTIGDKNVTLSADKIEGDDRETLGLDADKLAQVGDNPIYNFRISDGSGNISQFGEENFVTITLPYTLAEGEDVDSIAIWFITDAGALESIKATYHNGFVTFKTNHFSYYTVTKLTPVERCALYGHSYTVQSVTGSCTKDGYDLYVCVRCHESHKENLQTAQGHQYVPTTNPATCTVNGSTVYTCSACQHSYSIRINATGHAYEITNSQAATCAEMGSVTYGCQNCDSTYTVSLEKIPHVFTETVVAATCEESGYTLHACQNCTYSFQDSKTSPVSHEYVASWDWSEDYTSAYLVLTCRHNDTHVVRTPANVEMNETTVLCSDYRRCEYLASVTVWNKTYADDKATETGTPGHRFSDEWSSDGDSHWHACPCGEKNDIASHVFENETVTKIATCEEAGERTATCLCGATKKTAIPALSHNYVASWEWAEDYSSATLVLTCQNDGTHVIKIDGEMTTTKTLSACSPDYKKTVYEVKAVALGVTYTDSKETEIGTPTHVYSEEWSFDNENHWHECLCGAKTDMAPHVYENETVTKTATCIEDGELTATCLCGAERKTAVLPSGEYHHYVDGVCDVCGKLESECDHTQMTLVEVNMEDYGCCPGHFSYYTCACGAKKEINGSDGNVTCDLETVGLPQSIIDEKTMRTTETMRCRVCGLTVQNEINTVVDGCTQSMTAISTLIKDDTVILDVVSLSMSFIIHGDTVRQDIDLTAYGACGGYISLKKCSVCGENLELLNYDLPDCGADFEEDPEPVEEIGTDGLVHVIQTVVCPDCGLYFRLDTWTVETDSCNSTAYSELTIGIEDEVIATVLQSEAESHHVINESFTLVGKDCTEGITVTQTCSVCGMTSSQTSSEHTYEEYSVDLSEYSACGISVFGRRCRYCQEHYEGPEINYGCDIDEVEPTETTYTDTDGILHTVMSAVCSKCGICFTIEDWRIESTCIDVNYTNILIADADGVELYACAYHTTDEHHNFEVEDIEFLTNLGCGGGCYITRRCTRCGEESVTYNGWHESEPFELELSDYGCGGMITGYRCIYCGFVEHISEFLPECNIGDAETTEYTDENGFVHEVNTCACPDCDLVFVQDKWLERYSVCEFSIRQSFTVKVGETDLVCSMECTFHNQHQFECSYEMLGETCEDGYNVTSYCSLCGNYDEYTSYGHSIITRDTDLGKLGLCEGYVIEEYCQVCGEILHAYPNDYGCQWMPQGVNESGETEYECLVCHAVKRVIDEISPKDERCHVTKMESVSYSQNGVCVYSQSTTTEYIAHNFTEQYVMHGNSCNDGYTIITCCPDCGMSDELESCGHRYEDERVELQQFGMCDGVYYRIRCSICQTVLEEQIHCYDCSWVSKGIGIDGAEESYCENCGVFRQVYSTLLEKDGNCVCKYERRTVLTMKKGTVILDVTFKETVTEHKMKVSYEMLGEGCLDGYVRRCVCLDCGYEQAEETLSNHYYIWEEANLSTYGLCDGRILLSTCEVCGAVGHSQLLFENCMWEFIENDSDGRETFVCRQCGAVKYQYSTLTDKDENCNFTKTIVFTYEKNGTELFSYTDSCEYAEHNFQTTYEMFGESCEDGYTETTACLDCGYSQSLNRWGHFCVNETISFSDFGFCNGSIRNTTCLVCQKIISSYIRNETCQWEYGGEENGVTAYICSVCGGVKKTYNTETEKGENCRYTCTSHTVYFMNGDVVYDVAYSEIRIGHDFETTFDRHGETCNDGYTVRSVCKTCGYENTYESAGHMNIGETGDLSAFGLCGGYYQHYECPICGFVFTSFVNSTCQFISDGVSADGYEISRCTICNGGRLSKVLKSEKGENCYTVESIEYVFLKDDAEVYRTTVQSSSYNHNLTESVVMYGESCTDGFAFISRCTDCDYVNETYYEYHTMLSSDMFEYTSEGCEYQHTISVNHCPCGYVYSVTTDYNTLAYDDATQTYSCTACGFVVAKKTDTAKNGCANETTNSVTVSEGETVLYSFSRTISTPAHRYTTVTADGDTVCVTCDVCGKRINYEVINGPLTLGNGSYACEFTVTPTETERYTVIAVTDERTKIALYRQANDGMSWTLINNSQSYSGEFSALSYRVEAGKTYKYRLSYRYSSSAVAIPYIISTDWEGASCNHSYVTTGILPEGDFSCEDGIMTVKICRYCGTLCTYDKTYEHTLVSKTIDLTEFGACHGFVITRECLCGQKANAPSIRATCANEHTKNTYVNDEGKTVSVETYTCSTCGLRSSTSSYSEPGAEACIVVNRKTYTISIGSTLIATGKYETRETVHDYETHATFEGNGTSCTDGVTVTYTCRVCGYSYDMTTRDHTRFESERVQLSDYGCVCGGYAVINSCACGKSASLNYSSCQCDLRAKTVAYSPEYQEGISGSVSLNNQTKQYACAVTDPACGFVMRCTTYFVKSEEDCTATEYVKWQFGYNADTDSAAYERTFKSGNVYTWHTFVKTTTEDTVRYDCSTCGSYYYEKTTRTETLEASETVFFNALATEHEMSYRQSIAEETFDNSEGQRKHVSHRSYHKDCFANGDENVTELTITYVYYFDRLYTLSGCLTVNGNRTLTEYIYDFDHGQCRCTERITESDGSVSETVQNGCNYSHYVVEKAATCTQSGLQHRVCDVCETVLSTYNLQPTDHRWKWNGTKNCYYCRLCGLESSTGVSGSIIMEDLTASYGNGTDYVVGYFCETGVTFTKYVSLILEDGTEVVLDGITFRDSETVTAVAFSKAEVTAAAEAKGYTETDYDVRFTFVPYGDDGSFDYGLTFSSNAT